jgi:RNA recognition motif. (a.k.a. RRM, RBD, or RNP domain)
VLKADGGCRFDPVLADWPADDFRLFVGDLGNEVNDDVLGKAFSRYTSYQRCRVVRDKKSNKSKGAAPAHHLSSQNVDYTLSNRIENIPTWLANNFRSLLKPFGQCPVQPNRDCSILAGKDSWFLL